MSNITRPSFIDLFCGAGGLSLGFELLGFDLLLANDNDKHSINTFIKNRGRTNAKIILGDARNLSVEVRSLLKNRRRIDLVVGGPPCQGFSMANRQRVINDPRNILYKEFVKIVSQIQPRILLMENVKGMLSVADQVVEDFKKNGYLTHYIVMNAKNYGIPQNRERLIYLGLRKKSFSNPQNTLKKITGGIINDQLPTLVPLNQALWGLRKIKARKKRNDTTVNSKESGLFRDSVFSNDPKDSSYVMKINGGRLPKFIFNHKARYNNSRDLQIYKLLPQGGQSNHPGIAHIMPYQNRKNIFQDKFHKLIPEIPSKTITSHMKFDCHMYIHPYERRGLTPREAARIQSFPDNYVFYGPYTQWYNQVGNAVPPLFASVLAKNIKLYINSK